MDFATSRLLLKFSWSFGYVHECSGLGIPNGVHWSVGFVGGGLGVTASSGSFSFFWSSSAAFSDPTIPHSMAGPFWGYVRPVIVLRPNVEFIQGEDREGRSSWNMQ